MTINEKKQLTSYIKNLVRESISGELPRDFNDAYGPHADLDDENEEGFHDGDMDDEAEDFDFTDEPDTHNDFWEEMGKSQPGRHYEGPDIDGNDDPGYDDDEMDNIAGINELRALTESMARSAVKSILAEKRKNGKRKNKKEKTSSKDKTVVNKLNADGTNAAHYYYKLYGVENGTEAEKAAARSKGYKKAKGKKNDTGVPYKFSSKEKNRLSSLLTDR